MKKITLVMAVAAALMMTACNNKQKAAEANTETTETFEEQQIKAGMNVQLDSLTNLFLGLQQRGLFGVDKEGNIQLSADEKKVTPDYLFTPEKLADKLETLSAKYRALIVYYTDKQIGDLYEMQDVWTPELKKLSSEINDPALEMILADKEKYNKDNFEEINRKAYQMEEESGRANHFWEACATAIVEQTYLLSVNQEKLLSQLTDKDAEDLTYRIVLLNDSFEQLSEYNPQLMQLLTVLQPLAKLNAISIDQLREQLNESKDEIANSRALLFP